MLALGDRQYANFCRFGRLLDEWLHAAGATRSFERIDVDNSRACHPGRLAGAVRRQARRPTTPGPTGGRGGGRHAAGVSHPPPNEGSAGTPVYRLAFAPMAAPAAGWESGDIAQLALASDPGGRATIRSPPSPPTGTSKLLVRQEQHPDGRLGAASGLLTSTLAWATQSSLQLRLHRRQFPGWATTPERPLLLIGNGTGLAGTCAAICAPAQPQGRHDNWLVFGERNAAARFSLPCRDRGLAASGGAAAARHGVLARSGRTTSMSSTACCTGTTRCATGSHEVPRSMSAAACKAWPHGVDAALRQIAGDGPMRELAAAGRYRRDVY